jgi:hypothetical protein
MAKKTPVQAYSVFEDIVPAMGKQVNIGVAARVDLFEQGSQSKRALATAFFVERNQVERNGPSAG